MDEFSKNTDAFDVFSESSKARPTMEDRPGMPQSTFSRLAAALRSEGCDEAVVRIACKAAGHDFEALGLSAPAAAPARGQPHREPTSQAQIDEMWERAIARTSGNPVAPEDSGDDAAA